jgi:hypothetical protein
VTLSPSVSYEAHIPRFADLPRPRRLLLSRAHLSATYDRRKRARLPRVPHPLLQRSTQAAPDQVRQPPKSRCKHDTGSQKVGCEAGGQSWLASSTFRCPGHRNWRPPGFGDPEPSPVTYSLPEARAGRQSCDAAKLAPPCTHRGAACVGVRRRTGSWWLGHFQSAMPANHQ